MFEVRRRDFIALLGGAVGAWPLPARAQQSGRVRRIGVLYGTVESDPEVRKYSSAFRDALRAWAGWTDKTFKSIIGPLRIRKACGLVRWN